tara:strand:- start:605 stop:919 length:315 start_codon:yes stop_codon:yes gene_type:complete
MPILIEVLPVINFCLGLILATLALSFLARIVLSWYPQINLKEGFWLFAYLLTEPFLLFTKRFVSPIGGVDITPIIWFGIVSLLRELLIGPQGLLSLILIKSNLS